MNNTLPTSQLRRALLGVTFLSCTTAHSQKLGGGALIPDTTSLPQSTIEVWNGLPKGYNLPRKVDLSPWFPPAGNQGRQYACVPFALCYGVMSYRRNLWDDRTYDHTDPIDSANTFSPAFMYNLMIGKDRRRSEAPADSACKNGTNIDQVLEFAMITGSCTMKDMPFDTTLISCCTRPGFANDMRAIPNHIPPATILDSYNPEQWRYHLSQGQPILTTIVADVALVQGGQAAGGEVPFTWNWSTRGRDLFGHAVVCTGYVDDSTFTFINSWGQKWGLHGYFNATLERLKWKCSSAYVLSNDSTATWERTPGISADKDILNAPAVSESFEPGEYQEISGYKVKLASLGRKDSCAVMQVFDALTDTLIRNVPMLAGRAYVIYENSARIELRYKKRSLFERWFGLPVHFTLRTSKETNDAYMRARNAHLARLKAGLPK